MKQTIKIYTDNLLGPHNEEGFSYDDASLSSAISLLTGIYDSIPEEFRHTAKMRLYQGGDMWDGYEPLDHEIYYERLETDEEESRREEKAEYYENISKEQRKKKFEELSREFGSNK